MLTVFDSSLEHASLVCYTLMNMLACFAFVTRMQLQGVTCSHGSRHVLLGTCTCDAMNAA